MGIEKAPAFQFYPQDYLASSRVAMMSLEEEGAYIRLLCYCWTMGSIPKDPVLCARLAGKGCSIEAVTNVQRAFNECSTDSERLVHDRLEIEREKQRLRRESASNAGKKSGQSRAAKSTAATTSNDRSTDVQRNGNTSSSSSKKMKECVSGETQGDPFGQFWNIYPKKADKKRAMKAWKAALKDADPETIIAGAKAYADVKRKDPEFIKNPATWLNDGAWENEYESAGPKRRMSCIMSDRFRNGEITEEEFNTWAAQEMFSND